MANNKVRRQIRSEVAFMSPTELRLTAEEAQKELDSRRACWVHTTLERFYKKERSGMAYAAPLSNPHDCWATDRVIVYCFKDKSRSKVSIGVARLRPGDSFDYNTGVAIAFARAMGEKVPDLF